MTQSINRGSGTTTTIYFNRYYEVTGATTTLYIFLPNGDLLGSIEGNGVSTTTSITHTDHINSSSVMSDKNGNLSQLATFYPFGGLRNNELPSSGIRQDRLFLSQYTDEATSLNYLNARYENPTNGQFLSQDPMFTGDPNSQALNNPQSLNSYSYAENNPIGKSDPSGKCPHCLIGAGAGMLGQYGFDVYNNIQAGGFSAGAFYQNLSSPETYLVRAGQGAIIAGTGGLAGAMGLGLVGQSVAVGTASGLTSMGASKYLEGSINYKSAAVDAVVGAATFGAVGSVARVPGRLPNFGTNAFFTGAHTQQSALNLGIDAGASYVSSVVSGSFSQSSGGSTPSNMRTSNSTPQMTQSSYQAQLDSIAAQIKVIQQQINQLAKSMGKK